MLIGFREEPPPSEATNAVVLHVVDRSGRPVEGLDRSLQLQVAVIGHTDILPLRPGRMGPGWYDAIFIPPAAGRYTFRVFGQIGSTAVDEQFETGSGGLPDVGFAPRDNYRSFGAYLAFGMLGVYLAGLVVIAVLQRRAKAHQVSARR